MNKAMAPAPVDDRAAHLDYAKWICATKTAFPTREAAALVAERRIAADETLIRLCVYTCPACGMLHLTKKKVGHPVATRKSCKTAPGGPAEALGPDEQATVKESLTTDQGGS